MLRSPQIFGLQIFKQLYFSKTKLQKTFQPQTKLIVRGRCFGHLKRHLAQRIVFFCFRGQNMRQLFLKKKLQNHIFWKQITWATEKYSGAKKYWYPYLINTIEMRSLWTEKYIKSAARVLNRDCVNKRGLDLSKEVLWVS